MNDKLDVDLGYDLELASQEMKNDNRRYVPMDDYAGNGWEPLGARKEPFCTACKRYYAYIHELGLTKTPFPPECGGDVVSRLPSQEEAGLDDEEYELAQVIFNPVEWARHMLRWEPYWYQEEMLRCLKWDSQVYMADGTIKNIADIKIGDQVLTYDEMNRVTVPKPVEAVINQGIKPVYRITLENGDQIECTSNHEMYSWSRCGKINPMFSCPSYKSSYKSVDDGLSVGDRVFVLNKFDKFGHTENEDMAKLLGYIVTDGYVKINSRDCLVQFSNIRKEYVDEFECLVNKLFPEDIVKTRFKESHVANNGSLKQDTWWKTVRGRDSGLIKFLESVGCTAPKNREHSLLDFAFTFSEQSLRVFINRCWSGDGSVYTHKNGVTSLSFHGGNQEFLGKFRFLLRKLSVQTTKVYRESGNNGVSIQVKRVPDILRFFEEVGLIFGKEQESKKAVQSTIARRQYGKRRRVKTSSRFKIKTIEPIGNHSVFDLTVKDRPNFFANGSVVHNCSAQFKVARAGRRIGKTATIALYGLWFSLTHASKTVLVVAPFQAQVAKIFQEIDKFISMNSDLGKSVERRVNSPPIKRIFANGSMIIGFATGKNSGTNSDQIRGQDANLILMDELDFQNDYEIETIMAIMFTDPECGIWASSTPKGWRRKFYQLCTDKEMGFKEFHYISKESVRHTMKAEKLARAITSENGYMHEYYAEFGEEASGVYRSDLVDQALQNYQLSKQRPKKSGNRVMGVDWNAHAGTHIVIVEWTGTHYKLVHKTIVPKSEFTQLTGVERIIQLDALWHCDHIYVDEGFGSTQIEHLKRTGKQFPKTGLTHKVKGIQMGRTVTIREPVYGGEIKKSTKQFMVELSAHQLEEGRIILPDEEDTQTVIEPNAADQPNVGLVQQIRSFTVVRMSSSGAPIYSQEVDHTLVAWQLAILGFMMEYGGLTLTDYATRIGTVPPLEAPRETSDRVDRKKTSVVSVQRSRTVPMPRTGGSSVARLGSPGYRIAETQKQRAKIKRDFEAGRLKPMKKKYVGRRKF